MDILSLPSSSSGMEHNRMDRGDQMDIVRTDTGDWKLYPARQSTGSKRYAALTYGIGSQTLWQSESRVWPSVTTPFGVFPASESTVKPHQARFEWEILTHKARPREDLGNSEHLTYIWGVQMAQKALEKDVPGFVVQQLFGKTAHMLASSLLEETRI